MAELRKKSLLDLKQDLRLTDTSDIMCEHIIANIRNWSESLQVVLPDNTTTPHEQALFEAIVEQNHIRWEPFLRGMLTKKWNVCHALWEKEINSENSNSKWNKRNVGSILRYSMSLWKERCNLIHNTHPDTEKNAYFNNVTNSWHHSYKIPPKLFKKTQTE